MSHSAELDETPSAPVTEAGGTTKAPAPPHRRQRRRRWLEYTVPGAWGALIFGCLSFTPSLLPRGGVAQGLLFGISAAIGYGLGVLAAAIWRAFADREKRPVRPRSWPVFLIVGGVLLVVSFALGQYWQHEIRDLMGVTDYNLAYVVASPVIA